MSNNYEIIDETNWKRALHCIFLETVLNLLIVSLLSWISQSFCQN